MKIYEKISDITSVMLPNGIPAQGRLIHMVYKIESDEDAKELTDLFVQGIDITMIQKDYIFVRQFKQSKLAISKNLP